MKEKGIYAVEMEGLLPTIAILVFQDNVVKGIDLGGFLYHGAYVLAGPNDQNMVGKVTVTPSSRGVAIQTAQPVSDPFEVSFEFPVPLDPQKVYEIHTPMGQITPRFTKIRDL